MSRTDGLPARHVSVAVPHLWATRTDPGHGVVLAARSRERPPSGFAPELVVRSTPVDTDLREWRREAIAALSAQLAQFDLEDEDEYDLGGHPVAYRRFSHRHGTSDVVCEQWAWLVDGVGVTLTGSVDRADYAQWCDLFEEVAATVEIGPAAAA